MRNHDAALVAYRVLSDVAGKAAFLVVTVVAARRLAPAEFGVFALGTTLGWMVAVGSDLGMQAHLGRAVARRPEAANALLDRWLPIRQHTAAIGLGAATLALGMMDVAPSFVPALLLFVAAYAAAGLMEFVHHLFRGLGRTDLESGITLAWRGAMLACALAVLAARPQLITLAMAMLIPAVAALAWSVRRARALTAHEPGEFDESDAWSELARDVLPIGAGVLLSALYFRLDVVLVEIFRGPEAVGQYSAVFRLIDAMRLFPAAVLAVAWPSLVRASTAGLLVRLSAGLTAAAVLASGIVWAIADVVVPLIYGPAFADAVPAMRILVWAFPLMSLNYALTQQLIGWNGHRAYAAACAVGLAVNLAANARLIPALSIEGAAWATLWTEASVTAGCGVALWLRRCRQPAPGLPAGAAS